jgi:DNA modification methylase
MALTITMVKTSDLIPYEKNPRKNDKGVDAVANSIKAYGFKVPIVISSDNVVVTGHTRLKAAKKLGLEEVPCIIADDLSEEQIRQFRIVDNKTAELSDWDFDLLREELLALDEVDMVQFGFDDLDAILQTETKDDGFDFDEELPENPYSKRGDVYVLGEHRVMCGDSTLKEDVDILMNGRVADLIETDPPYNVAIGTKGKQYKERGGYNTGMTDRTILNDDMDDTSFREFLKKVMVNFYNNIKPGGSIYVFHADTEGLNFRSAFKEAGFKLSECLVWKKNNFVLGRLPYHYIHEPILFGWREGAAHYFVNDRTQTTVLEYDRPQVSDLHPTMKPIPLVTKLIQNSSRRGELVLDLFGGSGTTLIACEQIKRTAYLMELDEKYVDVIVKRYLKQKDSTENSYLLRDGKQIPLSEIVEFSLDSFLG